jgi:hypothetical protein
MGFCVDESIFGKPYNNHLDLKGWLIGIPVFFSDVYFCLSSVSR